MLILQICNFVVDLALSVSPVFYQRYSSSGVFSRLYQHCLVFVFQQSFRYTGLLSVYLRPSLILLGSRDGRWVIFPTLFSPCRSINVDLRHCSFMSRAVGDAQNQQSVSAQHEPLHSPLTPDALLAPGVSPSSLRSKRVELSSRLKSLLDSCVLQNLAKFHNIYRNSIKFCKS